jgi:hypothetical protein
MKLWSFAAAWSAMLWVPNLHFHLLSQQSKLAGEPSKCHFFDLNPELGEEIVVTVCGLVAVELRSPEWDEPFIRRWEGVVGSDIVSPISNVFQPVNPLFQLVATPVCFDSIGSSQSSNNLEWTLA